MKKEIKERFSSLVWKRETKNGCTNRELYLARAFLLGVPYCVLERKAETLPSTYSIATGAHFYYK